MSVELISLYFFLVMKGEGIVESFVDFLHTI